MIGHLASFILLARVLSPQSASLNVSATVGQYHFFLYGYTSPSALVTLEGMGLFAQTVADQTGYFAFVNNFSPLSQREVCLNARDQFGRTSSPVCLPPFPIQYDVTIGPVLLAPTISLDAPNYWQGDEIKLSGQTIPNTRVNLSTFVDENKSFTDFLASLVIKPVEAFSFPKLEAVADDKGNFSLSLPSSLPNFLRIFAQTNYLDNTSPESITLNLKVLPIWLILINLLKSRFMELIIALELLILAIYLWRRYFRPHALIVRPNFLPEEEEERSLMLTRESRRPI